MVRKKKKVQLEEEEKFNWPFEISIKISRTKPKVAFLSGCERGYYPEDPGHSKFALTYCFPDPDDTARCNYTPSDDLLQKPISTLGYGIGGLLGPRFPREIGIGNPAPNVYQDLLVPEPVQEKKKIKKTKWNDFVEMYERIAEQQYSKYETDLNMAMAKDRKKSNEGQSKRPSMDYRKSQHIQAQSELHLIERLCKRHKSAFGMSLGRPRFERLDKRFVVAGVGTYDWSVPFERQSNHITNAEGKLIPRVRMVCLPGSCDICRSCGEELIESDYYQTKTKFRVINRLDPMTYGKYKYVHLSFCRACYCHALKHGHQTWSKEKIPYLFIKARHCSCIHDHKEGHKQYLTRATCKAQNNLSRKEILYNRYFKDAPCERSRPI